MLDYSIIFTLGTSKVIITAYMGPKEYVVGPAIRLDEDVYAGAYGERHDDVIKRAAKIRKVAVDALEIQLIRKEHAQKGGAGFVTTAQPFVDRKIAYGIAKETGRLTTEALSRGIPVLHSDEFLPPPQSETEDVD
jgi:hypothetical protein